MADNFSPEIGPNFKEEDVERVLGEVERHRENPETKGASGQEIVRRAVQSVTGLGSSQAAGGPQDDSILPDYAKDAPAETKLEVETLIQVAFAKGISEAAKEASNSSPYVIDAFHDALSGKLYTELERRGLIK